MSNEKKFEGYFTDENSSPDRVVREIPTISNRFYPDRVPTGYEPMGEIQLRGRAASGFASGRMPWWIVITGWLIFAPLALFAIYGAVFAIAEGLFFAAIIPGIIASIIIAILWRGTKGKLERNKRKRKRRRSSR